MNSVSTDCTEGCQTLPTWQDLGLSAGKYRGFVLHKALVSYANKGFSQPVGDNIFSLHRCVQAKCLSRVQQHDFQTCTEPVLHQSASMHTVYAFSKHLQKTMEKVWLHSSEADKGQDNASKSSWEIQNNDPGVD